ncbi:MAG: PD40 domain-containing protein [Thermoflexales bacterium]|nr:PD40 domain-containing protein [Thermoflexales bacterium]
MIWQPEGYQESPEAIVYVYGQTYSWNTLCMCDLILTCSYEPLGGGTPPVPQGPAAGRLGRAVGPAETVEVMVREFPSVAEAPTIEEPLRSGAGGIAIRRLDRPVVYLLYYPWYWPRNLGAATEHRWHALVGDSALSVVPEGYPVYYAVIQRYEKGLRIGQYELYEDDDTWGVWHEGPPLVPVSGVNPPPSWEIVFVSNRDGNEEIYAMASTGGEAVRLTNNPARDTLPVWSPDKTRIAFTSDRDGNLEVYVMGADGSHPVNLTRNPAADYRPIWSPDGSRIVFTSNREGGGFLNEALYVMNADGSGVRRLTGDGSCIDIAHSWMGNRIAFSSCRDGNGGIYLVNADGSGLCQVQVSDETFMDFSPAWSPTRERRSGLPFLAFVSNRGGTSATDYDIWAMVPSCEGLSTLWPLITNPARDTDPTWSPDGRFLAFASDRDGDSEIYVTNADGTGLGKLTDNSFYDGQPNWR